MAALNSFPEEMAVITSKYVVEDGLPILYVFHDDDEEGGSTWQFHCGNGDYNMEKMRLVQLRTILRLDSNLELLNLEIGDEATRLSVTSRWLISNE